MGFGRPPCLSPATFSRLGFSAPPATPPVPARPASPARPSPARPGQPCPPSGMNLPHWCRRRVRRFRWGHSRVPPSDTNLPYWCHRRRRRFRWGHSRVPPSDTNLPHWCGRRLRRLLATIHNRGLAPYICGRRLLDDSHNRRFPLLFPAAGCETCKIRKRRRMSFLNLHVIQPAAGNRSGKRRLWKSPNNRRPKM